MRSWMVTLLSLIVAVSCLPAPAAAQFQGFMRILGLPGESQVEGHQGEIELMSYMQSATTKACFSAVAVKASTRPARASLWS